MTTPDRVLEGVRARCAPAGASSPSSAAMATWPRSSPQCRPRVQRMATVPARSSGTSHGRRLRRPPAPAWLPRAADRMHAAPDRAANRRGRLAAGFRCAAARRSAGRGPSTVREAASALLADLPRNAAGQPLADRPAARARTPPLTGLFHLHSRCPLLRTSARHTHDLRTPHPVRQTVGRPRGRPRIRQRARRAVHRPAPDPRGDLTAGVHRAARAWPVAAPPGSHQGHDGPFHADVAAAADGSLPYASAAAEAQVATWRATVPSTASNCSTWLLTTAASST